MIEHTNRVIFLEDDDVAAVVDGRLSIHRIKRTAGDYPARAIQTLQMELQQIMKGKYKLIPSSEHSSLTDHCSCVLEVLPRNFAVEVFLIAAWQRRQL